MRQVFVSLVQGNVMLLHETTGTSVGFDVTVVLSLQDIGFDVTTATKVETRVNFIIGQMNFFAKNLCSSKVNM